MSRKSLLEKNKKRIEMAQRYYDRRQEIKRSIKDSESFVEKLKLIQMLDRLPRDSSFVRVRNRCNLSGRARGYYRRYGLSRIKIKECMSQIPGLKKASW